MRPKPSTYHGNGMARLNPATQPPKRRWFCLLQNHSNSARQILYGRLPRRCSGSRDHAPNPAPISLMRTMRTSHPLPIVCHQRLIFMPKRDPPEHLQKPQKTSNQREKEFGKTGQPVTATGRRRLRVSSSASFPVQKRFSIGCNSRHGFDGESLPLISVRRFVARTEVR